MAAFSVGYIKHHIVGYFQGGNISQMTIENFDGENFHFFCMFNALNDASLTELHISKEKFLQIETNPQKIPCGNFLIYSSNY